MGKPTGFMEITRQTSLELPPEERIRNFNEFHVPLHTDEQQAQGARCMDCGVPFCQSGVQLGGMFSGCPLNNLIPEWNDLVSLRSSSTNCSTKEILFFSSKLFSSLIAIIQ